MLLWPHLPVWPLFLVGTAILFRWNKSAALAFAQYWILFQVFKALAPYQLVYFTFISCMACVTFLYIERTAGTVFAMIGLIYATHIFGDLSAFPKFILTEAFIAFGMIIAGIIGPTSGLLAGGNLYGKNGHHSRMQMGGASARIRPDHSIRRIASTRLKGF